MGNYVSVGMRSLRLQLSSSFPMAQLKQRLQYWHSLYGGVSLLETLSGKQVRKNVSHSQKCSGCQYICSISTEQTAHNPNGSETKSTLACFTKRA